MSKEEISEYTKGGASPTVLSAVDLVKRFGSVAAVEGVSLAVQRGEVFGLLGPNGAGKTTMINLLTGLARPDSGSMFLDGLDYTTRPKPAQAVMGIVPDESNLYDELSGFDNLTFCAALYGLDRSEREDRADRLLSQVGLQEASRRPFRTYSKGMKRRLTIAAGIIHRPLVLFLDEPTTGIDVAGARQIRSIIETLNREGTTVFLTTHYIEEAERLCNRVGFIVAGRIVRVGTIAELMLEHQGQTVLELSVAESAAKAVEVLALLSSSYKIRQQDESRLRLMSDTPVELLPLLRSLAESGIAVLEAKLLRPSLEEVFVKVTGLESRVMRQDRNGRKA